MKHLGAELVEVEPGQATIRVTFRHELTQQHNYFHAGVSGAIADSACGYAAYTRMPTGSSVLTVESKYWDIPFRLTDNLCDINRALEMNNLTSNAAIVEKARTLYEGREAIYCEHGVLRVRVNRVYTGSPCVNITSDVIGCLAFDLEEIPTQGLPVWVRREPPLGPHPLRWTISTNLETRLFPRYLGSPPYVGWSLYFATALVREVVGMATNSDGNDALDLYLKIRRHIDDDTMKLSRAK